MKQKLSIAIIAIALSFNVSNLTGDVPGILIPAYGNPTFMDDGPIMWNSLVETVKRPNRFKVRAIINPFNGPGATETDQQKYLGDYFGDATNEGPAAEFRRHGGETLGYVWTDRGRRDPNLVKAEINAYLSGTYVNNFDGIFLDDFFDAADDIGYYQDIFLHMQDNFSDKLIVGNVGNVGDQFSGLNSLSSADARSLIEPLDTLVSHEMPRANYENDYMPFEFEDEYNESKFAHLAHDAGLPWNSSLLDLALSRKSGWVYATPDDSSDGDTWNNFDPVFWDDFTNSLNAVPEPSSGMTLLSIAGFVLFQRKRRV